METNLSFLLNKVVARAEITHDYLQLFFNDSAVLNIFNSYQLNDDLSKIQNSQLVNLERNNNILHIKFMLGLIVSIDMSDDGYSGPEAMVYYCQDKIIVID